MRSVFVHLCAFLCLLFVAYSGSNPAKSADKVVILYYVRGQFLSDTISDPAVMGAFEETLKENSIKLHLVCPITGEVRFLRNNDIISQFGFTIGSEQCQHMFAEDKAWRLTYIAGMFLSKHVVDLKAKQ